jgi:sulfonate transport system ATP-binding protein
VLELRNVTKRFGASAPVLSGLSFKVEPGSIVALLGGSGTGKSTILRLIAGLDRPTSGDVWIDDTPVRGPNRNVGVVFQEPRLMPWLDVAGNVGFGLSGMNKSERATRVDAALERVGLTAARGRLPKQLSGGMAQRVALARALVTKPQILLLDEPFSALDALLRTDLQDHLLELWADATWGERRPTMLMVTHDIEEAIRVADRVLVLTNGAGQIAADVKIDLVRPRDRYAPQFARLAGQLLAALGRATPQQSGEEAHPAAAI